MTNRYTGTVNHWVDALGLLCPMPVAMLATAVARLAEGSVVELVADDPAIELDLPAWCHQTGHHLLGEQRAAQQWRFWIKVSGSVGRGASETAPSGADYANRDPAAGSRYPRTPAQSPGAAP